MCDYFTGILLTSLKDKSKVSKNSCAAIEKLAESLQPVNKALANPLTPHFSNLACALLINAQRTDEDDLSSNFVHSSYAALIALV